MSSLKKAEDSSLKSYWSVFFVILIVWIIFMAVMFWSANNLVFDPIEPSVKIETLGVFGDSFNILTSLFTGLAFAGVIISVELQRKELKATREELEVTRGEIEGQKLALEDQKNEMEQQSFDNRFFQMLNSFSKLRETILSKMYGTYNYVNIIFHNLGNNKYENIDEFKIVFNGIHTSVPEIRHYHINMYQILKLVDRFYIDDTESGKFYTNIVRAQMSANEQLILLLHAYFVQEIAGNKLKLLVEKYALLEHINPNEVMRRFKNREFLIEAIFAAYELNAFGKNDSLLEWVQSIKKKETGE